MKKFKENGFLKRVVSMLLAIMISISPFSSIYAQASSGAFVSDVAQEQEAAQGSTLNTPESSADNKTQSTTQSETPTEDTILNLEQEAEPSWEILINNKPTLIQNPDFTNAPTLLYGEDAAFTLKDYTGDLSGAAFLYLPKADFGASGKKWTLWGNGIALLPGDYYLGYDEVLYDQSTASDVSGKYGVHIEKAALKTPSELTWVNGTTAS